MLRADASASPRETGPANRCVLRTLERFASSMETWCWAETQSYYLLQAFLWRTPQLTSVSADLIRQASNFRVGMYVCVTSAGADDCMACDVQTAVSLIMKLHLKEDRLGSRFSLAKKWRRRQ